MKDNRDNFEDNEMEDGLEYEGIVNKVINFLISFISRIIPENLSSKISDPENKVMAYIFAMLGFGVFLIIMLLFSRR